MRVTFPALVAAAVGAGAILAASLAAQGYVLANGSALFGDAMAFWSAGHLALTGRADQVHDPHALYAAHHLVAERLGVVYLWHHPPTFLLVAAALAALPYPAAAAAWLGVSLCAYAAAARALAPGREGLILALAAPGVLLHFVNAQTGLLTAALIAFGCVWAGSRPLAAGAAIALLAVKPHLGVVFPLALAAAGRWTAFAAASAGVAVLCGAAALAFGPEAFVRFAENLAAAQTSVVDQAAPQSTYASLFASLVGLGAPAALAAVAHAASALAALSVTLLLWRREGPSAAAGAALAAATTLISPYLFFYDLTALLVGAGLLVREEGWRRLGPFERTALLAAWASPALVLGVGLWATVPVGSAAAWAILTLALTRSKSAGARPAPTPPR